MVRRVCPICDQVIKKGNYCSFCKRWVRHPKHIDVTYYLNERHPEHEMGCEYHTPFVNAKPVSAGKTAAEKASSYIRIRKTSAPVHAPKQGNKQKSPFTSVMIVMCVIFFIFIFMNIFLPILFFMI